MRKSFIILSCILAIWQLGNVSHALDNVPASTRNYELSNSHEEPMANSDEDDSNRKTGTMGFLILLKNSKENDTSTEEETEDDNEQINGGQKTKRCMALNHLRKTRLISIPKDARKNLSRFAEKSINDNLQNLNDGKSYFRLASRKDTDNILKSLLKSRSSKGEDNPIVSKSEDQNPIILVRQDLKKSDNQRPKKYVCYCIEDNCVTKNPKQPSRPNAMRTTMERNILAKNSFSTNEDNRRISDLVSPQQQNLGAAHNLHCPPGAVLVEESDYSECSNRKHQSHKRRPVKKCLPIITPCESEAESIGQPMRINFPFAGSRKFNSRVYKVDRQLPFVQKLQALINHHDSPVEVPCDEKFSPLNSGLGVEDYYSNNQKDFDRYAQVPMGENFVHPSPYVVYTQHSQYPQYSDSLVGDSEILLKPVDQPYKVHQEQLERPFLDTEECIKKFGPSVCTVLETPSHSGKSPKITEHYEEEHEESTIGSQWEKEMHTTTELPARKINKWNYPTNSHDNDKIAKTYLQQKEAGEAAKKNDEKKVSNSGRYSQSRIPTKPEEYHDTPGEYFSGQPINIKNQASYNLPRITNSDDKIVSSTDKKPTYFDDHGNFVEPNSLIRHSDPNNMEYLKLTTDPGESETEDYYDVTEEAREDEVRKTPSVGSVLKFPQLATTRISSPQYREFPIKPTGKDVNSSLSEDNSEEISQYVSTPQGSSSRYETSADQYSKNIFHQEHDRNVDEVTKYYTTQPIERVGFAKQHSIHGSLSYDDKRLESSTKSPNTVFMKMEEPSTNYETTISTENFKGNGFQGSQRVTTVYPVIDNENHTLSPSARTQSSNNRIAENSVPSANLYYSIQPEQTVANFAPTFATKMKPQSPVGIIESTPINNYLKSDFVSSSTSRSDNHYPTSHVAMKNVAYDTTPLLGINKLGQRKFTVSYPAENNVEVKTISSWPNEIKETNIEDNQGEKPSTLHYPARSEIADVDKYSSTQKSPHDQYIGSPQLTNYERTAEQFYTQFFGANEPTTGNVISTKKHTDYLRKPVGRPENQYTTSYIQNLPAENIESANEHILDKDLSKEVTNHYSRVSSGNWDYGSEYGKKMTSFVDQEASTTDRGAHRQSVGSHRSFADGIVTTSRSDHLNNPTSHVGTIHSPTAAERFHQSTQQPSKMSSSGYNNLYSSQSGRPLSIMNHRKSTQPEDVELGLPTADNNYSAEDAPNTYTTAEPILGESATAETETHKLERNRSGKSRHRSKESHRLITTPSKYDDSKEIKRPLDTTLSFENNSDMKEEFNGYVASDNFDDKVEEVTGSDSYYEKMDPKNYNDFISTISDESTVMANNESKDINSSRVVDEEVGLANLPKATTASGINNSKHYMRYHNGVGKSHHRSKESHQLITTPSKYDNSKEIKRPLDTTLSFENNSAMKEKFNGYVASNNFDDKVEEVTGSDSYYEKMDPKNYNDFISTISDESTVTDNNESKDINSSRVADEEVGVANLPKAKNASSVHNSKHYMRYHNGVVEESTPKETTLNDELIIETQSYKEDDNDFSPMIQTVNGDTRHLYPGKNYEEKHLPTNYYETVGPESKDDITRISKDEFENPSDTPYSSTPMSVTHYVRNPSTFSDIFKSGNVVHDKSTEGRSNDYSTDQYLQNTPETHLQNPVKYNDKSSAVFEQKKLASQGHSNNLPTMNTLKKISSAVSKKQEKLITISNKLFGKTNEEQPMTPYNIVGATPSKENLSAKIENDVSSTQPNYCTESLAKTEPSFNTDVEKNALRDASRLNNQEITDPSYSVTEFSKFKEFTPSSDLIRDALMTTDDETEATAILSTETTNQQNDISKKDSSLGQFTASYDRIDNVQKGVMKLSATPETNDENAIEPIGTKNELPDAEYMDTNDYSSFEHSQATEYSPYQCEPMSSSPTVGHTPSSRSFAVSEDLTLPTLKQVPSSTSKNKESVEKPLGSDSTTSIGKTELLGLFSRAKSEDKVQKGIMKVSATRIATTPETNDELPDAEYMDTNDYSSLEHSRSTEYSPYPCEPTSSSSTVGNPPSSRSFAFSEDLTLPTLKQVPSSTSKNKDSVEKPLGSDSTTSIGKSELLGLFSRAKSEDKVQKGIMKVSAIPEINDKNAIEPIGTKNELPNAEYMDTNDYSSFEHSPATEYSPYPCEPMSFSSTVGNPPSSRSFAISEDLTLTSKNEESVEKPLGSDSTTSTGKTELLGLFSRAKSEDKVQKGIKKVSATPIATTPETDDENDLEPIGTKNELPDAEYMDTNDYSSFEHSPATEYSQYPCEPTSSSPTVGNPPSSRSFAVSEDLTLTSKNEESVEKPLGSDSTTSTGKTELLGLFSRAKSEDKVQKGIKKVSATPIATTPETDDENDLEPIGTKNELPDAEYMDTNDYSSFEHSPATEYSQYPCEPTSSSPTVGNTPSSRSFAVSEDVTLPALNQVPSSTSKDKESVEKPLGSDSTTSIGKTELLGLFPRAKSAGCSTSDDDRSYLTSAVQRVVQNLISPESNNPYKNAPNTPDTVLSSNQGSSSELPVLKNLFSLPEVKDMVINTVKGLISEASAEDILLSRLKDQEIESVLNEVVNNLLPGKSATLTTSTTMDKQYKNGHWMAAPASLAPIEGNVLQKPADEMFSSIQNIIERPEIGLQGAKLPAVQNIIVHAVENVLTKAKKVVNHSLIWETLNNIIALAENAENSKLQSLSTLGPMPKISDKKTPRGSLKNMPVIPVIERVFKNGQWSDKRTVLGIRKKPFDYKLSPSTTAISNDDSELRTLSSNDETSMIDASNLKVTTDAADYAFLGESEEQEDQSSTPDVVEVNGNVPIEKILESVDATATEQNIEHEADPENAPIKYYSPNDRILTYIKNHQTLEGKTGTILHSSDTNKGLLIPVTNNGTNKVTNKGTSKGTNKVTNKGTNHCPSPDMQQNEFSTTGSLVEFEHATMSDNDEVPIALGETAESEESGERITSGHQSTTQTHRHKFTKIPKYHDSSQEATTLTRGLLGAAKSRGKSPSSDMQKNEFSTTGSLVEFEHATMSDSDEVPIKGHKVPIKNTNKVTNKGTNHCPSPDMQKNEFSTTGSLAEFEHATMSDSDEVPVSLGETAESEESGERITSGHQSTTQTHRHKFPKIPKYHDSSQEATTLTHGLLGAAKSRGKSPSSDMQNNEFSTTGSLVEFEHATMSDSDEVPIKAHKVPIKNTNKVTNKGTNKGTNHCPSPDMQKNEFSTTGSLAEFEHSTMSDNDEVPIALGETAESEESGERITSGHQSTIQTHRHKFPKIPKYHDSSQEATTLTRGLLGAAKIRGKTQQLQENIKDSSNFATPDSDPTYFGKLTVNGGNPSEDRISDLTNTDLFYIGDGVKIPLTIRRMPDGSYALSISEKICERFINRKCPCCVPNEGDIVEESRKPNVDDRVENENTSKRNSYDSGSFEPTESSEYESESKRRYVRSTSGSEIITTKISPVKSFVKKYNMTLNLPKDNFPQQSSTIDEKKIQEIGNTRRNKRLGSFRDTKIVNLFDNDNQLQRDDSEEEMQITDDNSDVISKESNLIRRSECSYDKDMNSFVDDLLHIRDVPENKRTEIVVNALDGLINSASVKNLIPMGHRSMTEFIDEDSTEDQSQWADSSVYDLQNVENKIAGYGYQKDNPILERIRFIKENQHGHGQYKYQQNIDHHARGKMNILKTVLHWLREVFLEVKGNDKK